MSARVRLDALIIAAGHFLTSPDIRPSVTRYWAPGVLSSQTSRFEPLPGRRGDPADRYHSVATRRYSSGLLNSAAHSPEDSQRDRKCRSARLERTVPKGLLQYRRISRPECGAAIYGTALRLASESLPRSGCGYEFALLDGVM